MRNLHLQHHDRDDDRDHAVAECRQPLLAHLPSASRVNRFYEPKDARRLKPRSLSIAALLRLANTHDHVAAQEPPAGTAVPRAAIAAIVDAYRHSRIVAIGDAHGNQVKVFTQRPGLGDRVKAQCVP